MKKLATMAISIVLIACMVAGGSLAYLQDQDEAVNVMTLGSVKITQHEYQRANGIDYKNSGAIADGDELEPFEQGQLLFPSTYTDLSNYTAKVPNDEQFWWGSYVTADVSGNGSSNGLWDDKLTGAMDKFVFVENTGKSPAYYRTLIAFECPEGMEYSAGYDKEFMMNINLNNRFTWEKIDYITVNDARYLVMSATYNKVLEPNTVSRPSLLQVVMTHNATNEDMELLGEDYKILVLSQAVQTAGFADAKTALDTAFGEANAENVAKWFGGIKVIDYDYVVSDLDGLKAAFAEGGNILLKDDIKFEKITTVEPGKEVYLNLNGKTITVDEDTTSNTLLYVKDGAKLTIDGNGTIDLGKVSTMAIFAPYGELVIENGTFTRDKVTTVTNKTTGLFMGCKVTSSNVTINGGYFDPGYYDKNAANIEKLLAKTEILVETEADKANRGNSKDANIVRVAVKDNVSVILNHSGYGSFKIYGGTFVGANPAWGDEGCMLPTTPNYLRPWSYYQGALLDGQTFHEDRIVLPDGYSITQGTTAEGIPTYTVNYNSK